MLQSQRTRPNVAKLTEAAIDTFENHDQDALRRCMERLDGVTPRRLPFDSRISRNTTTPGLTPTQSRIHSLLQPGGWWTARQITEAIGCDRKTTSCYLTDLKKRGMAENRQEKGKWLWRAKG